MHEPNELTPEVVDRARRELLDRVRDLHCLAAVDGYFKWVSGAWEPTLGYSARELLSRPFVDFVHPLDRERTAAETSALGRGQETVHFENRYRAADGRYVWIQWNASPGPNGLIFATGRDVSERKQREQEVAERSKLLTMTETMAGIGRWRIDLATGYTSNTQGVFDIYGLCPADGPITFDAALARYHEDDRPVVAGAVGAAAEAREEFHIEARVMRHDGSVRWVESRGAPEIDTDGQVVAVFGISRDVTEDRKLQETLRRTERMVALGTMAAGIAHEINNPLSYLHGNLQLIEERLTLAVEPATGEILEMVRDAMTGSDRLRGIIDGMHAMARSDRTEWTRIESGELVRFAVELSGRRLTRGITTRVDPDVSDVVGDSGRLAQVLVNLVVNASQAMDDSASPDAVEVSVASEGADVVFDVADRGLGISPEARGRMFDPFFTTKPVGSGLGLGLSISLKIVEEHGGRIDARDRLGGGTIVSVRLPLAAEDRRRPPAGDPAREPLPRGVASERRSAKADPDARPRLLLIDDETAVRRLLERALQGDFDVVAVASGAEAIETLREDAAYDAVLCDLMMPMVTGKDVMTFVRTAAPHLAERMVFATGGAFTMEMAQFLDEEAVEPIAKPFDLATLRSRLAAVSAG